MQAFPVITNRTLRFLILQSAGESAQYLRKLPFSLATIYEVDFCASSFGFRPGPHDALRTVQAAIMSERVNWVVDADIRTFFSSVDHAWLERMTAHRTADPRIMRLIRLWLRAGVMDDGVYTETLEGTQQGAGISPLLANIYLHYVLDLWVAQWQRREARGHVRLVRFADGTPVQA